MVGLVPTICSADADASVQLIFDIAANDALLLDRWALKFVSRSSPQV